MAPTRGTPTRPIRIDPTLWERFGRAVALLGGDRSGVLREFIRWYVREPGAKMPKRPDEQPAAGE
ncbi:hypothetical protein O7626_19370 [Micromonospora sp. WMMD1102]|uniref:hypothetical protein n=1 Tax=Micromonospora sp. WMMD1102 TaxID=3016105 RepID=UPI002415127C|nr:hypothetical protein [Micromonospora sp. WMMD1102]MDG4788074.1 hypothetical protein [Micromonospora sp. WMMD1102]